MIWPEIDKNIVDDQSDNLTIIIITSGSIMISINGR